MPKAELHVELENPRNYFKIIGGEKFRDSKVKIRTQGNKITVQIDSGTPKALISSLGSMIKQIRIIEQTSELVE